GYARRRVSRPRRHANPRTARAVCRELRRQLQRVPATEGGAPSAAGPRGSSPGARDRAPGAVHRALSREEQQGDARQEPREGAGVLPALEGWVRWAPKARVGYYDQHRDEALERGRTVLEEVQSVATDEPEVRLRTVLGQFLFRGDDAFKRIEVLSGGERSRVALAKLVLKPTNVLVLDEPTNHLDRSTRRKLLEVLEKYPGTILCAAHDPAIL